MDEQEQRVYKIPSGNLGTFQSKFAKLVKRARKLGLPEPTYTEHGTERREIKNPHTDLVDRVILYHLITIDPKVVSVKVEGWTFVATIQLTEEGNIVRTVPGSGEIPTEYRNGSDYCQHCKTSRNRKDTFLLRDDGGEYKLVGRNCLQDFMGRSALQCAEQASYLCDLCDMGEGCEEGGFGGGGHQYDALETYLAYVAEIISIEGWMSRGRARALEQATATADIAMRHLHPSPFFKPMFKQPSPESIKTAEDAIAWAQEIEGENISDYLHNIRLIARRMVVDDRTSGLAASIVAAYQRHLGQLRQQELRKRQAEISQYVGEVGQRQVFKLYVDRVLNFDGPYGSSCLVALNDDAANAFCWWCSTRPPTTGQEIYLKGTIKKHSEFKGLKQTTLSRCQEVEMKRWLSIVNARIVRVEAESEAAAKKAIKSQLGLERMPKGTVVVEDIQELVSPEPEAFAVAV